MPTSSQISAPSSHSDVEAVVDVLILPCFTVEEGFSAVENCSCFLVGNRGVAFGEIQGVYQDVSYMNDLSHERIKFFYIQSDETTRIFVHDG